MKWFEHFGWIILLIMFIGWIVMMGIDSNRDVARFENGISSSSNVLDCYDFVSEYVRSEKQADAFYICDVEHRKRALQLEEKE